MRERLPVPATNGNADGITPARAGKTYCFRPSHQLFRDHPRSCGKDNRQPRRPAWFLGLPPLVRERLFTIAYSRSRAGITPARAGKTGAIAITGTPVVDHPRSCGKDLPKSPLKKRNIGSPPLVRERPKFNTAKNMMIGITPARAGKTLGRHSPMFLMIGSPPLVRERH